MITGFCLFPYNFNTLHIPPGSGRSSLIYSVQLHRPQRLIFHLEWSKFFYPFPLRVLPVHFLIYLILKKFTNFYYISLCEVYIFWLHWRILQSCQTMSILIVWRQIYTDVANPISKLGFVSFPQPVRHWYVLLFWSLSQCWYKNVWNSYCNA